MLTVTWLEGNKLNNWKQHKPVPLHEQFLSSVPLPVTLFLHKTLIQNFSLQCSTAVALLSSQDLSQVCSVVKVCTIFLRFLFLPFYPISSSDAMYKDPSLSRNKLSQLIPLWPLPRTESNDFHCV